MNKISASIELYIPFYDVDPMEIVWHGNYIKYFEKARCHLLNKIDYNYSQMKESGYAWPVIDVRVKYIKPLVFSQVIKIQASIVDIDYGLKINFLITDSKDGTKCCTGYSKQVAVEMKSKEMCLLSPQILIDKIQKYENRH